MLFGIDDKNSAPKILTSISKDMEVFLFVGIGAFVDADCHKNLVTNVTMGCLACRVNSGKQNVEYIGQQYPCFRLADVLITQ
jgi:hypothetical protein